MVIDKEIQIKEERGLWKASSYIHNIADRLIRKKGAIRINYLLDAHRLLFEETGERAVAGKYRRDNPTLKRIDGTELPLPHWGKIPNLMAILDEELKNKTIKLSLPIKKRDYIYIIDLAVKTSHRLACIHPFYNGNGRISRLLIDFILLRSGLPTIAIKEDKDKYLNAMLQADKGDFIPLKELVIKGIINSQNKKLYKQKQKSKSITFYRSDFK